MKGSEANYITDRGMAVRVVLVLAILAGLCWAADYDRRTALAGVLSDTDPQFREMRWCPRNFRVEDGRCVDNKSPATVQYVRAPGVIVTVQSTR